MSSAKLLLILVIFLQACGGEQNTRENSPGDSLINGVKVPVAPDAKLNASTLQGIDSDTNGIRDDVDRKVAEIFGGSAEYLLAVDHAKSLQASITKESLEDVEKYLRIVNCSNLFVIDKFRLITIETLNSPVRKKAYVKVFAGVSIPSEECNND